MQQRAVDAPRYQRTSTALQIQTLRLLPQTKKFKADKEIVYNVYVDVSSPIEKERKKERKKEKVIFLKAQKKEKEFKCSSFQTNSQRRTHPPQENCKALVEAQIPLNSTSISIKIGKRANLT